MRVVLPILPLSEWKLSLHSGYVGEDTLFIYRLEQGANLRPYREYGTFRGKCSHFVETSAHSLVDGYLPHWGKKIRHEYLVFKVVDCDREPVVPQDVLPFFQFLVYNWTHRMKTFKVSLSAQCDHVT